MTWPEIIAVGIAPFAALMAWWMTESDRPEPTHPYLGELPPE